MEEKMDIKVLGIIGLAILLSFSACLEGLFDSTEDDADTTDVSFVGKWCLVTQTENGVKETHGQIITMNEDGSGTFRSSEDDDTFTWSTLDGVLKVTLVDEIFEANYQFDSNTVTLTYEEEGHTYVELYAKHTGEKNEALIGKWTGVRATEGGVDYAPTTTVTFGTDGSAVAYFIEETEIDAQVFSWSTSGNYLLNDIIEDDSEMWTGIEYTLAAPLLAAKEYYDDGVEYITTFINDSGEKDNALNGTWSLTGLTVNGGSIPPQIIPQGASFTLDATTGTGAFVLDETPVTYTWTTNSGYLLIYPTAGSSQIGIGQEYNIEGATLTFSIAFNAETVAYYFGSNQFLAGYAAANEYVKADFTFTKQ